LSRRLGDDPLSRAKSERAKAPQASASAVSDPISSHASYNDVFFKRRAEGLATQQASEAQRAPEAPEISEISEIPEIREVAAAPSFGAGPSMPAQVNVAQDTIVPPFHQVSIIEEAVARLNGSFAGTTVLAPNTPDATSAPASTQAAVESKPEARPEPQKSGGFFKRLFGKFK
jgi:hypothetical protein